MAIKILICFLMIATNTLSQSFCFRITPSTSSFFGTYQTKILEQNNSTNLIETKKSNFGNIGFGGISYGLNLTILKFHKFLMGISIFNSGSSYGSGAKYTATSNIIETPPGYARHSEINYRVLNTNNLINLGINVDYEFNSKILFRTGLLYQKDKTNIPLGSSHSVYMVDGVFSYDEKINQNFMNKKSFGLNFEFERTFLNKRNKKIISIKMGYLQGFRIMGSSETSYNQHPLNYKMTINAISRGSAFFIGISKSIKIYEKNN